MFDRFRNRSTATDGDGVATTRTDDTGRTAVAERPNGRTAGDAPATSRPVDRPVATRDTMHRVRARQREEYGGINWGAAFFGWLVAVGVAVLLTGVLTAAGAAIDLTHPSTTNQAASQPATTLSVAGAIALLVVLAIAYYCGGYVAGRMSRFDGARQGIGAWVVGLLITIAIAAVAIVFGSQYNVVERANLPRLPIGQDTLTAGGVIASAAILLGTLLFAALGGVAGARYHHKVDRAGYVD